MANSLKKCSERDKKKILAYLSKEKEMNLFFYGDIFNYGFQGDVVAVYEFFDEDGQTDSLLLKYRDDYVIYSQKSDYGAGRVYAFLEGKKVQCISGKKSLLVPLAALFPAKHLKSDFMCRCNRESLLPVTFAGEQVLIRQLGIDDYGPAVDLLSGIEEFAFSHAGSSREKRISELSDTLSHGNIAFGAFIDGCLVSVASASASNDLSAMVVGVATDKAHRGSGLASSTVSALCRASFEEGRKFLCLFYDNPEAGSIYRKLGFKEIGEYGMLV